MCLWRLKRHSSASSRSSPAHSAQAHGEYGEHDCQYRVSGVTVHLTQTNVRSLEFQTLPGQSVPLSAEISEAVSHAYQARHQSGTSAWPQHGLTRLSGFSPYVLDRQSQQVCHRLPAHRGAGCSPSVAERHNIQIALIPAYLASSARDHVGLDTCHPEPPSLILTSGHTPHNHCTTDPLGTRTTCLGSVSVFSQVSSYLCLTPSLVGFSNYQPGVRRLTSILP